MALKSPLLAVALLLALRAPALPAAGEPLVPSPAPAPTRVSGLVARDTTWSGTVSVVGKVQVLSGCTLTLEPGTRVLFAVPPLRRDTDEDRVFVQKGGTLVARGTGAQPIVFSSATPDVRWFGVELHSGHDRDAFAHCIVRGSRMGIACVSTSPTVENCTFEDNQQAISLWRQAKPVIRACSFQRNAAALVISMQSAPTVTSSTIEGATEVGIRVDAGSGGFVDATSLRRNRFGIRKQGAAALLVSRSRFEANEVAVSIEHKGAVAEVRGNAFHGNQVGVMVGTRAGPRVEGNTFEANETAVHFDGRSTGSLEGNDFVSNRMGLRLSRTSSPSVEWNVFTRNDTAVLCEYSSYPVIEHNNFAGNATALRAGDNQSYEWSREVWPGDEWEALARGYGAGRILARGNYWGEEATRAMEAGLTPVPSIEDVHSAHDVVVDGKPYRRDEVSYRPFLTEPLGRAGAAAGPSPPPAPPLKRSILAR